MSDDYERKMYGDEMVISEAADRSFKDDSGKSKGLSRASMLNELQEFLGEFESFTSGIDMNKYSKQYLKKSSYRQLEPFQSFVKNAVTRMDVLTSSEQSFLIYISKKLPNPQFKNPAGVIFAYRYFNFLLGKKGIPSVTVYRSLSNLVEDAKKYSVPPFDIVRYFRLIYDYLDKSYVSILLTETDGLKNINSILKIQV